MAKYDIVYILKNDISSDEIRYSLRSVCENFPFKRIIFIGGCPEGIKPDVYIPHEQTGSTKWQRARSSLLKILKDENISDKFFLFNDDFYVLKKQKENFLFGDVASIAKKSVIAEKGHRKFCIASSDVD